MALAVYRFLNRPLLCDPAESNVRIDGQEVGWTALNELHDAMSAMLPQTVVADEGATQAELEGRVERLLEGVLDLAYERYAEATITAGDQPVPRGQIKTITNDSKPTGDKNNPWESTAGKETWKHLVQVDGNGNVVAVLHSEKVSGQWEVLSCRLVFERVS